MSYSFDNERAYVFTEDGQKAFLAIRDEAARILKIAGAVRMGKLICCTGSPASTWSAMACVDRLVELGELTEIKLPAPAGQYRIFVAGHKWGDL